MQDYDDLQALHNDERGLGDSDYSEEFLDEDQPDF